jgi:hypothetical protein
MTPEAITRSTERDVVRAAAAGVAVVLTGMATIVARRGEARRIPKSREPCSSPSTANVDRSSGRCVGGRSAA